MKRETRANMLFVAVFLAISIPGAVLLFRKKLDPSAPRMDRPDAVVQRLPYMARLPTPPGVRWIVPPRTQQWLLQLTRQRAGTSAVLSSVARDENWQPVISEDHRLQIVALMTERTGIAVSMIVWQADLEPRSVRFSLTVATHDATRIPTRALTVDRIPVPFEVRRELTGFGMIRPPADVIWLQAEIPIRDPTSASMALSLGYQAPDQSFSSEVMMPNPDDQRWNSGG